MRVMMLGVTHQTAPVELRERLALAGEALDAAVGRLRQRFAGVECVLLSTCNRMELYIGRPALQPPTADDLRAFLVEQCGVAPDTLAGASILRENEQAVAHLFRVACGLDSMVLGEPQILGQVKRAYEQANRCAAVGPVLHAVFQDAIAVAKKVRTQTGINEGRMSVGSVAVDFAQRIFERFDDKTVVGIGAGEMAKLTLRHLQALKPAKLWLANRSLDRAAALAQRLKLDPARGGPRAMADLDELLVEADIVLTSTGATEPIITEARFRPLLRRRKFRSLFIIDLGVPRDVAPAVGSLSNVYLYNIDDLQSVINRTQQNRSEQLDECERMLFEAVHRSMCRVQHQDFGHLVKALRHRLHTYGELERERTARRLAAAGAGEMSQVLAALEEHNHRLINKILHLPLSQLHDHESEAPLGFYAAALRKLFSLDDAPPSPDNGSPPLSPTLSPPPPPPPPTSEADGQPE